MFKLVVYVFTQHMYIDTWELVTCMMVEAFYHATRHGVLPHLPTLVGSWLWYAANMFGQDVVYPPVLCVLLS